MIYFSSAVFFSRYFRFSHLFVMDFNKEYQDYVDKSFGEISKTLRKDSRNLHNRIQSIISDSKFVTAVSSIYKLPLVGMNHAN